MAFRLILLALALQLVGWLALLAIPLGEGGGIDSGDTMLCAAQFSILVPLLAVPASALAAVFELLGKRRRRSLIELVVAAVAGMTLFQLEINTSWSMQRRWYRQMTQRTQPLITAITEYQTKHGVPPPDLEALVPEFLPVLPGTGMRGFPKFRYLRAMDGRSNPLGPVDAEWELYFFCGCFVGLDQIFYWPGGNYPTGHTRGGVIERIGDWAYVHE